MSSQKSKNQILVPPPPELTQFEKEFLLRMTRSVLQEKLGGVPYTEDPPSAPALSETAGVFVTLYTDHDLRGCIGQIESNKPLWKCTREMTIAAATRDPRFNPIKPGELSGIRVEISILGPLVSVEPSRRDPRADFLELGEHGVQISLGNKSGLLLPQVAEKFDWDAVHFIEETALKAGLESSAWLDKSTDLKLFRALRFQK